MQITQQEAQAIVDEMKASIHRDINIMDESGLILASTNPARRGQLHQGALRIIREGLSSLIIWKDEPEQGVDHLAETGERLSGLYGRRVSFRKGKGKSYIMLEYYDNDYLDALIAQLLSAAEGK